MGGFKSIVWKGFEVLLPEALYKIDKQCQDLTAISRWQNEGGPKFTIGGGGHTSSVFYKNLYSHSLFLTVTSNHRQFWIHSS